MPKVGRTKYPYTKAGVKKAKAASKRTGKSYVYKPPKKKKASKKR